MMEKSKTEKAGKRIGFGIALLLFTSILYYLNSKFELINLKIAYKWYIFGIALIYIFYLALKKLIKG